MAFLPVPSNAREIGECIYCGFVGGTLGKEHVLPYGLNGPWTLLRASCPRCADITHRFERDTLRGLLSAIRPVPGMQTRRRKNRPATMPLVLESAGVTKTIQVLPSEFPLYLPTPTFPPPGAVTGIRPSPMTSPQLGFVHVAGPSFDEIGRRHGADFVGARLTFSPQEFGRTLAKIAYGAAVYALGIAPFKNAPIRLFAQFGAPEYHVVLGPADPAFVGSKDWPWK